MKLLLDQNLSRKLLAVIKDKFPDSKHVSEVGLSIAGDLDVWRYAREHDFAIISKDSDCRQLSFLNGAPPKVIWLQVGNRSTQDISRMIEEHTELILGFDNSPESFLIIHAPST